MSRLINSAFSNYFAVGAIVIWSTGMLYAAATVPAVGA